METQKSKNQGGFQTEKTQSDNFKEIFKRYNQQRGSRVFPPGATNHHKHGIGEINSTRQKNSVAVPQQASKTRQKSMENKKQLGKENPIKFGHRRIVSNDFMYSSIRTDFLKIRPETGANEGIQDTKNDTKTSERYLHGSEKNGNYVQDLKKANSKSKKQQEASKLIKSKHRRVQSNIVENFAARVPFVQFQEKKDSSNAGASNTRYSEKLQDFRSRFKDLAFRMKQDKEEFPSQSTKTQNIYADQLQNSQTKIDNQNSPSQISYKQEKIDLANWSGLKKFEPGSRNEKIGVTEPDITLAVSDSRNQRLFNKRTKTANPSNNNSFENNIAKKKSSSKKTTQELIQEIKSGQYFSHKLNQVFSGNYGQGYTGQKVDFVKILGKQKDGLQSQDLATKITLLNNSTKLNLKHKRINSSGFNNQEQPATPPQVVENNFLKNSSELIKKKAKKKDFEGAIKKISKQAGGNIDSLTKAQKTSSISSSLLKKWGKLSSLQKTKKISPKVPNQTFTSYHSKNNSLFTSQKNWKPEIRPTLGFDHFQLQSPDKNSSTKFLGKKRKQSHSIPGKEVISDKQQVLQPHQNSEDINAKNHIKFMQSSKLQQQNQSSKLLKKTHKKNSHSMPFQDPTNQLIQFLKLPINLDKQKQITMTPGASLPQSPEQSPRIFEEENQDGSFVSHLEIHEDEHDEFHEGNVSVLNIDQTEMENTNQSCLNSDNKGSVSYQNIHLQITQRSNQIQTPYDDLETSDQKILIEDSNKKSGGKLASNYQERLKQPEHIGSRFHSRNNSFKGSNLTSQKLQYDSLGKNQAPLDQNVQNIKLNRLSNSANQSKKQSFISNKNSSRVMPLVTNSNASLARLKYDQTSNTKLGQRNVVSGNNSLNMSGSKLQVGSSVQAQAQAEDRNSSPKKLKEQEIVQNFSSLTSHNMPVILQRLILQNKIRDFYRGGQEDIVTTLEFYQFNKLLGEGSFGKVYSAYSILTEKEVAIKCFDKAKIRTDAAKRKIFQEVKILRMLDHRNVTKLLEVFENRKFILFVMEYAEEGDILKLLKQMGPLDEKVASYLTVQIVNGLKYCHSKGVLHRDIKLDNVLLSNGFVAKICDFGVSTILSKNQTLFEQCGTPAYIAPEVIKGEGYSSFQPDVWNLGILLYAMVTGTVPFKSSSIDELHQLILKGEYEFPPSCKLSPALTDLITKMLILDPSERISIDQMLNHPWLKQVKLENDLEDFTKKREKNDDQIIKKLMNLGFPKDQIQHSLDQQILNHIYCCYHLLRDR